MPISRVRSVTDKHDVHDADAAHEQRDADDAAHYGGHRGADLLEGFADLLRRLDPEVVLLAGRKAVGVTQQPRDLVAYAVSIDPFGDRQLDDDVVLRAGAVEAAHGGVGKQHVVVLADAEQLAASLHHADHLQPFAADLHVFADGIVGQAKGFPGLVA